MPRKYFKLLQLAFPALISVGGIVRWSSEAGVGAKKVLFLRTSSFHHFTSRLVWEIISGSRSCSPICAMRGLWLRKNLAEETPFGEWNLNSDIYNWAKKSGLTVFASCSSRSRCKRISTRTFWMIQQKSSSSQPQPLCNFWHQEKNSGDAIQLGRKDQRSRKGHLRHLAGI